MSETQIQLCGQLLVRVEGANLTDRLPGRKGRLLFAYLCANRLRPAPRSELAEALWGERAATSPDKLLDPVVSRLRAALRADRLVGRTELRLVLPADARVDTESALEAIHRAEGAVRRGDWAAAWGPARVALHVTNRTFLPGGDGAWVDETRSELDDVRLRAHECVAASGLGLGGAELDSAKRSGRALVKLAPHRESGYRLLMETLAAEGNAAEALDVYETLRLLMQDELGVARAQSLESSIVGFSASDQMLAAAGSSTVVTEVAVARVVRLRPAPATAGARRACAAPR